MFRKPKGRPDYAYPHVVWEDDQVKVTRRGANNVQMTLQFWSDGKVTWKERER